VPKVWENAKPVLPMDRFAVNRKWIMTNIGVVLRPNPEWWNAKCQNAEQRNAKFGINAGIPNNWIPNAECQKNRTYYT
jgi:hypothetical protein